MSPVRRVMTVALAFLAGVGGHSDAFAEAMPLKGTVDSRIRTAVYKEDEVYKLYGFVGFDIEVVFAEGEYLLGKGGGDLAGVTIDGVTIEAFENHVHLKPAGAIVATNLVLYSNRRVYRFEYTVFARRPNRFSDEVMYAVKFTYPDDPKTHGGPVSAAERVDKALSEAASKPKNLDYWYCGNRTLRPVRAYDDGIQTHLMFGARAEQPAVFLRNDDGTESLLNFTIDNGDMVIHRVARRFVLRRGKLTGCVVNQSFVGGGERLDSGTITPQVERVPKGARQ